MSCLGNPGGEDSWERVSQCYEGYDRNDIFIVPLWEFVISVCNAWSCSANMCAWWGNENKAEILRMAGQMAGQILDTVGEPLNRATLDLFCLWCAIVEGIFRVFLIYLAAESSLTGTAAQRGRICSRSYTVSGKLVNEEWNQWLPTFHFFNFREKMSKWYLYPYGSKNNIFLSVFQRNLATLDD